MASTTTWGEGYLNHGTRAGDGAVVPVNDAGAEERQVIYRIAIWEGLDIRSRQDILVGSDGGLMSGKRRNRRHY